MEKEKRYYVYLYRRKDTNDVCYVGKGTKGRAKDFKGHNDHCNKINDKVGLYYEIIKNNLSNEEALQLEKDMINYYVFDLGYGIDMDGYRKRNSEHYLCNCNFGGKDGNVEICYLSDEELQKRREKMLGDKNIAKREDVRRKISEHAKNNNSFSLPEVREKLSKNHYMRKEENKQKASKRMKEFYKTDEGKTFIKKISESNKGKIPYNAIKVICIETNEIYNSYTDFYNKLHIDRHYLSNQFKEKEIAEIIINNEIFHFKKLV